MATSTDDECYLELCSPIRFEAVTAITNVFFDDVNKQIFVVRAGGAGGVVVKGLNEHSTLSFCIEDKGSLVSVKFSSDHRILAIQRHKSSVEFVNFQGGTEKTNHVEYSQSCKAKNADILGFVWTASTEIVFVTNHGLELYQVYPEKRQLKLLKSSTLNVQWFLYCPLNSHMLLSTGAAGNILQPFQFKPGNMHKLVKFEVDLPTSSPEPNKTRNTLLERDCTLAVIYGKFCVLVLRHHSKMSVTSGAEIAIYTLQKDGIDKKTVVLKLDTTGRFAVNVVDSLIIVHHQGSKTSMLFDLNLAGESNSYVTHHHAITVPLPIKPFRLKLPTVPSQSMTEPTEINCELYSATWISFQPNIIIDAKIGCLWSLDVYLEPFLSLMMDKCRLVDFLMQRSGGKPVLLSVLKSLLVPGKQGAQQSLLTAARVFDRLNDVYRSFLDVEMQSQIAMPALTMLPLSPKPAPVVKAHVVIDQSDMYTHVFSQFVPGKQNSTESFVSSVLIEYIRSLTQMQIPVQHYFYELVINSLVKQKAFFQLHQFLQYHVVSDSKPLACLLLSLESVYPAARQLALDMLKRLSTANEEIVEVLLSKQQIVSALKFVKSTGSEDSISARKFLEAAKSCDPVVFYSVYNFFEQRNLRLRGSAQFTRGELCDIYIQHFQSLFGKTSTLSENSSSYSSRALKDLL